MKTQVTPTGSTPAVAAAPGAFVHATLRAVGATSAELSAETFFNVSEREHPRIPLEVQRELVEALREIVRIPKLMRTQGLSPLSCKFTDPPGTEVFEPPLIKKMLIFPEIPQSLERCARAIFGPLPERRIYKDLILLVHQHPELQHQTLDLFKELSGIPALSLFSPQYPIADLDFARSVLDSGGSHLISLGGMLNELWCSGSDRRVTAQRLHVAGGLLQNCLTSGVRECIYYAVESKLPEVTVVFEANHIYVDTDYSLTLGDALRKMTYPEQKSELNNLRYLLFKESLEEAFCLEAKENQAVMTHAEGKLTFSKTIGGTRIQVQCQY